MRQLRAILPEDTHTNPGNPWVTRLYVHSSIVITFASFVHVFGEIAGADSIAGIDLAEQVRNAHPARDFPRRSIGDLQ